MERKVFRQIRNEAKDIEALAAGYMTKINHELWLADGLQKDAVQNCWDARIDKKHGHGWECGFLLRKLGGKDIVCITDAGTTGLNGTKFHTEEELLKILNANQQGDDLAYFLNSNWSAKSTDEGGNRGRGKTLFLVASLDKKIFFDSLRLSDDTYVFGELYLDTDNQVKFVLHYDKDAKEAFKEAFDDKFSQLTSSGTRIFITNPDRAILTAIKDGEMISFISNSRWETIKKYNAKIFVDNGHEKKYAETPHWYEDELQGITPKEFPPEIIKEGTRYKTKRLVLRYAPELNLTESVRGIAIQRGGMTIQRVPIEELIHEVGTTDIYGWLEMEKSPLEDEMKLLCEGPEHCDFGWTVRPAKYLRDYLRIKVREFAKALKILESEQARKNKIQKSAEEEALKLLAPFFKRLGLFGKRKGTRKKKPSDRRSNEPLRLSISEIQFPRDARRVNWGEKILGTYVIPINDFQESILVLVRVFVIDPDGHAEILEEKEINLRPGSGPKIGPELIEIFKRHKRGGYSLRAKLVSLEDKGWALPDGNKIEKGTVLYDRINQKFYVEMDPPESGPFDFRPRPGSNKNYIFDWEPDGDGYVIYYNDTHPRILPLLGDEERLREYLIE